MIAISFRFPLGRYHATPWEHHVNEGVVEWPPSPWRLVRALLAASYRLVPAEPQESVRELLEQLITAPSYSLPRTTFGHTRHYMPTDDRPTKVFDAFAAVGDEALVVAWPNADLNAAQKGLLDRILDVLGYLGRRESWVEATRVTDWNGKLNCEPTEQATIDDVRLLAVSPPFQYRQWREGYLAAQEQVPKKQRCAPPEDWWQTLHLDTGRLFSEGWSDVPGTTRLTYRLAPSSPGPLLQRGQPIASPTIARFELRSAVRPRLTDALAIGDRMRQALIKWSDGLSLFSGRDAGGEPMRGHRHAFYLPADDDGDGYIDHLTVFCRSGFPPEAVCALEKIRRLWSTSGHDIRVVLVRLGGAEEFKELGPASVWESRTPFVLPRHIKRRGEALIESPKDQLNTCLIELGLPRPRSVALMETARGLQPLAWHRFLRVRQHGGGSLGSPRGFGFRLQFDEPVRGPIAVGYGSHQGLGQFAPGSI